MGFICDRLENIFGKGENAGYQHFLLFQQCFYYVTFSRLSNLRLNGKGLKMKLNNVFSGTLTA